MPISLEETSEETIETKRMKYIKEKMLDIMFEQAYAGNDSVSYSLNDWHAQIDDPRNLIQFSNAVYTKYKEIIQDRLQKQIYAPLIDRRVPNVTNAFMEHRIAVAILNLYIREFKWMLQLAQDSIVTRLTSIDHDFEGCIRRHTFEFTINKFEPIDKGYARPLTKLSNDLDVMGRFKYDQVRHVSMLCF